MTCDDLQLCTLPNCFLLNPIRPCPKLINPILTCLCTVQFAGLHRSRSLCDVEGHILHDGVLFHFLTHFLIPALTHFGVRGCTDDLPASCSF